MASSRIAPRSISRTRSATSSCKQSTRRAEHRCPALSKADTVASATTCSASAEESTIIAFWPPVSAMSGMGLPSGSSLPASVRWMMRATSVEPVKTTPRVRGSPTKAAPTVSPGPGTSCNTSAGTPAACMRRTASAAMSGVCSAGFASTGFPAASAALTWPVKIASGKFQGLMHTTGPRARCGDASRVRACPP
jgi:hypothetical protein